MPAKCIGLVAVKGKVMGLFDAGSGSYSSASVIPVQKEPRPLMRLKLGTAQNINREMIQ